MKTMEVIRIPSRKVEQTSFECTEWIEKSDEQIYQNCEVERDTAPQRNATAHPEQQEVC